MHGDRPARLDHHEERLHAGNRGSFLTRASRSAVQATFTSRGTLTFTNDVDYNHGIVLARPQAAMPP